MIFAALIAAHHNEINGGMGRVQLRQTLTATSKIRQYGTCSQNALESKPEFSNPKTAKSMTDMQKPNEDGLISVSAMDSIDRISPEDWDACACPEAQGKRPTDPFTTHRFLKALEDSGSVGERTGWIAWHLVARAGEKIIAVMPLYVKTHSQGEYIFDHNWAHAFETAGGRYYPKLQSAVPFTPVTGRRLLARPGHEKTGRNALLQGVAQLLNKNNLSSFHMTFCLPEEAKYGKTAGLLHRTGQQFHWRNHGYSSFDGFLESLSSRKRKNIRKERERAGSFGGTIKMLAGDEIKPEHWDAFWMFYQDTGSRKWGSPYLTRAFFDIAHETLREDMALVMCERGGHHVAGALNFIGRDALFGRYWGCVENHPDLHFEACYYQAIDFAIQNGLECVEAGAQGEHKLSRGYMPKTTHSLHLIANESFRNAVHEYLIAEREAVDRDIEIMTSFGPFKKTSCMDKETD